MRIISSVALCISLLLLSGASAFAQDANDIQMLPPLALGSTTTTPNSCTAAIGNPQFLAWDGHNPLNCVTGFQSDSNSNITITPSNNSPATVTALTVNGSVNIAPPSNSPTVATALTVNGSLNISNDTRTCATGSSTDAPAGTIKVIPPVKSTASSAAVPAIAEMCDGVTGWIGLLNESPCSAASINQALKPVETAQGTGPVGALQFTAGTSLPQFSQVFLVSNMSTCSVCGDGSSPNPSVQGATAQMQCLSNGTPIVFGYSTSTCGMCSGGGGTEGGHM